MKAYRDVAAAAGELHEFRIDALDRIGIPIMGASVWTADGGVHGTGYGATEDEAARGALGELVEGLAAHDVHRLPHVRGRLADLAHEAVDPAKLCLPAGSSYTADTELLWVTATRWPDGAEVLVPIEMVATCFADLGNLEPPSGEWLTTPITNGLGAGDTLERAISHGILELLQRDGNSVSYRALDLGVVVEVDDCGDELRGLLDQFEAAGIDVLVKLAATDFGMANVYVVGRERDPFAAQHPLMVTSCGEAVHPDRERAVRKALLEYASSRSRKAFCQADLRSLDGVAPPEYAERARTGDVDVEEDRALDAMLDWLRRPADELQELMGPFHAERSRVQLSELPTTPETDDPAVLLDDLAGRLGGEHLEVLYVDLGRGAVRVIVPGLEVETATYHRCGERNLRRLESRGLAGRGPVPQGARPIPGTTDGWLATARIDELVGDLYPLYREPDRHVAGRMLTT